MCMFSPYLRVACLVQNEIGVFHNGFIPFESGEVFGEIRITFPCVRFHPKQPESIVKKKKQDELTCHYTQSRRAISRIAHKKRYEDTVRKNSYVPSTSLNQS